MTSLAPSVWAQQTAVVNGTVRNAVTGAPVADATIRVLSGTRSCVTGGDGTCRLVVAAGRASVRATAIGFAPGSQSVLLAPGDATSVVFALEPSVVPLDEIVTVGTRAFERTASQSLVPVDVLSRQLLDNTGLVETWQQFQRLVPSANVPHIPIGDNHARPVTLRGLSPHHVLVLVNGKRRHPASTLLAGPAVPATGFTDLNAIPSGAIERIEVLRDGAAAQYGSDAIGGVVNIVLKSGAHRDLRTSVGTVASSEGGRSFGDGRLFSATTTVGLAAANGGYLTASGELRDRGGTNRAYPDRRQQYLAGDPRNDDPARVSSYFGNGSIRELLGFLTAATPLADRIEAYAVVGVADRQGESPDAFFRRPLDPRTVRAIHPDGFLPVIESRIADVSALAGVRGSSGGWRWDVSSAWGRNRVDYSVGNSNNASLGAESPTDFYVGRMAAAQWTSNADVFRDLTVGSIPVGVAAGVEFRVDRYQIRGGAPDSWRDGGVRILDGPAAGRPAAVGSQGMIGFRPVDEVSARRNSSAAYLEIEGRPLQRLQLQAAVRAERFSDFGSTSDGKLAGRLDIGRGLAVRGSFGTGFRAPALSQQHLSSTRTVFEQVSGVNTVLTVRTFPVNSPEAKLLGATPLRPEQAVNRSAGLVLDVPRLPLITVDAYQIDLKDRIGLGTSVTDTALIRLFEANGMRGIAGGNFFGNAMDVRTRGVDVVANHAFRVGHGVMRMIGGYNQTRNTVVRVRPPPPPLAEFGAVFSGRTARGVIEQGQPRETITLTVNYDTGPLGLTLHNQRFGATAQLDQVRPEADQVVSARWITDARVSYQLRPRMQLAVSAANLFDVYPDEWFDFKDGLQAQGPSMQGIFRHPGGLSPFGMNGRTLYLQFAYR
ncbi:MAG: TonB-dependent receptor [Gemmatimonadales bacterium]|nr:TonB-dependent receptor [Gemmatimonadales bacterium]